MKSMTISLEMAQRVKDFVAITQNCDCEILLKSGKYVVDAKSILGIFSLDLSKPLTVEIYSDDCEDILGKLAKFKKKKKTRVIKTKPLDPVERLCSSCRAPRRENE